MPVAPQSNYIPPSEQYMAHGDSCPPLEKLQAFDRSLSTTAKPYLSVIGTNVLQDLAVADPDNAEQYLDKARDSIDEMLDTADALYYQGYESDARKNGAHYAAACLLRAELPHWLQAAQSSTVSMDYETMLDGMNSSTNYVAEESQYGTLAEFIPLLLFARAEKIYKTQPYIGRLSLVREDRRLFSQRAINKNWDMGVSKQPDASGFVVPEDRVQVKRGKEGSRHPYNRAGIIFLRARVLGFGDPLSIADSCTVETGESVPDGSEILTSDQLDGITDNIIQEIDTQRSVIAEMKLSA
jgi:hypothetical protein